MVDQPQHQRGQTPDTADPSADRRISELEEKLAALEQRIANDEHHRAQEIRNRVEWVRRQLMIEVDRTRSRLAVSDEDLIELARYRQSPEYAELFEAPNPLVTVTISTYNRADVLITRSLASVMRQDYQNLEIIVVDDGSTDETQARVREISDPRVVYARVTDHLLPPELGAGIEARNLGLTMATGDFVTHLDDDDEYTTDRVSTLLEFVRREHVEFVWHPFWWQENVALEWEVNEAPVMEFAGVTTSSVLYMGWLKRYLWDLLSATRYDEPDDWTLFRTFRDMGVSMKRYPEPLLRHYKERQNPRWAEGQPS